MSLFNIKLSAVMLSAFVFLTGCSAANNSESVSDGIDDITASTVEPITVLTVTKAATTTAAPTTTVKIEETSTTEKVTATGYSASVDYATLKPSNSNGETGSGKPVTFNDLYVTTYDVGVLDGYTLDWTGTVPWSVINILDSNGNYYVYDRDSGVKAAVNSVTGDEYAFDMVTSDGFIDGFVFYDFPKAESYTLTLYGSAPITDSYYPCEWNGFVTYIF